MNKFATLLLLAAITCVALCETIPFTNVYMRSYNVKDKEVTGYYWGLPGNFTLDEESDPKKSTITVTLIETPESKLSDKAEASLKQYVDFQRVAGNFIILNFKATQISVSEYDKTRCGLFQDTEMTYDIDMPIDKKTEQDLDFRLEYSFVFDVAYSSTLDEKYDYLQKVCNYKFEALSLE